jgi:uncharacterized protein
MARLDRVDPLTILSLILLIVGGLNWLLTAFGFNVVEAIFGRSIITQLVYIIVGLAAIYMLYPLYQMLTRPADRPIVR